MSTANPSHQIKYLMVQQVAIRNHFSSLEKEKELSLTAILVYSEFNT